MAMFIVANETKVNIISFATIKVSRMNDAFHLSAFLPYQLAVLSERISRRLSVEYGKTHGLTVAEWRVLVHLQRCGAVSVRDIHNCVNLEKPRVSRAVSRLEAAGYVKKDTVETDGRLVAVSLTAAGRAALECIIPAAQGIEAKLRDAVGKEDMQALLRVMEKMHAILDADPDAKPRSPLDLEIPGSGNDPEQDT